MAAALANANPSHAADIARNAGTDGVDIISVSGTFETGDEATFKKLAAASGRAIVVLNSGGGNLAAGLGIGRAIRLSGFATAVLPDNLCGSACALTWLAGSPRLLDAKSRLGFHAAYQIIDGHASVSGTANARVGAYLDQLGLADNAIEFVTTAPPEGVEWLTTDIASSVGIPFQAMSVEAPEPPKPARPVPNDPLSATTAFYAALASADGETAAALVVPEKRGKGPFNEQSIHAFYGAMTVPMKLTGTTLRGADGVRVSYEYTTDKGRACRGRADVQTLYAYGRRLISQIRALDGC